MHKKALRGLWGLLLALFAGAPLGALADVQVSGNVKAVLSSEIDTGTFSCSGAPVCTGIMTMTLRNVHCSGPFIYSQAITISGLNLAAPGPLSLTLQSTLNDTHVVNPNGSCTYTLTPNVETQLFAGNWDGKLGTFSFSGPDPDQAGFTMTVNAKFTASGLGPPPVFPMTVTSNITPTSSSVTATIQPKPADAGKTESIYVFAIAPLSKLVNKDFKDGPDPCVLAQVNSGGQLVGVTSSTMTAAFTGVINSQGQAVTILNNVSTPNVAGASMYVGYGATAQGMFSSGTFQGVVNVPGSTQCQTNLSNVAAATSPGGLTGLWWNASESGWGIHFTQRGSNVFAAWYTYDTAGKPKWYVSTCAGVTPGSLSGTCNGTVYDVSGPAYFGVPFNPSLVSAVNAGTLTLTFTNANAASMFYSVGGVTRTVALTRQPLSSDTAVPAVDYSDIWWGGTAESGWGIAMAQQSGITFVAWYVYDANGKPTWLVATCTMNGSTGTGTIYRTTGPAFGPSFNPNSVTATAAGTITVNFTDPNNAILNYTVDGVTGQKQVTRQIF